MNTNTASPLLDPPATAARPAGAAAALTRVDLLARVFAELNRGGVPVVVTHNHADLATNVDGDVDCVIPASYDRHELLKVLGGLRVDGKPVRVVQWLDDGAAYIAVAAGSDRRPVIVQIHVSPDFELDGRLFYTGEELVAARRADGPFFVTPPEIEFACVLLNRIHKHDIADRHAARLSALYAQAPAACTKQLQRFWPKPTAAMIASDAESGDFSPVRGDFDRLAREARGQSTHGVGGRLAAWARQASRWLKPKAGLHVVFLGPDGVGKSTVIEQVREAIKPAFLADSYHTFAPSLIPHKLQKEKATPHALPPRGKVASLIKAAWWSLCYTGGYMATIHPERVRGNVAINHRYLLDAIVDPKRYRYSGPTWLLRAIWAFSPKPDFVFLLSAPAEIIQARKKEVPFEETARQVEGYRTLLDGMPYGRVINAARPLDEVVADVNAIILNHLADRTRRNVSKGATA